MSVGSSCAQVYAAAMRLAFLSHIYSNLPALEAVLADLANVGVDSRFVLGEGRGLGRRPM